MNKAELKRKLEAAKKALAGKLNEIKSSSRYKSAQADERKAQLKMQGMLQSPEVLQLEKELSTLQQRERELLRAPSGVPAGVRACVDAITDGTTTRLQIVDWNPTGSLCIAKDPGRTHYLSRGSPSKYIPTRWYLLDLTKAPPKWGLLSSNFPGKLDSVEGRLPKEKYQEWMAKLGK